MKILIRDINPQFVAAAYSAMGDMCTVEQRSALAEPADGIVSPANSFGFMDGGIDYAYSEFFGWGLQDVVQAEIAKRPFGELLVGEAMVVPTGNDRFPDLVVAPTMRCPKVITDPADVMLATRAAVRSAKESGLSSLVIPGMGTGCGRVPFDVAAKAMRAGIDAGLGPNYKPDSWRDAQHRHYGLIG